MKTNNAGRTLYDRSATGLQVRAKKIDKNTRDTVVNLANKDTGQGQKQTCSWILSLPSYEQGEKGAWER